MSDQQGFDVTRARRETPGCEKVVHLNNAGASLMPQPVLDVVVNHLRLEAEMGGYEAADYRREAVEHTYDAAAALIGAQRSEIAILENATRAWDMAFYSIPFQRGQRILTSVAEYASNYISYLQIAQRFGVEVEAVPNDADGQISIPELEKRMDKSVRLISITHVPTNGGLVNPAAEVGKVAKSAGVLYLLDACQSVGQMPVMVDEIGCDLLSVTGRKFLRGPRGTGFLYVRSSVLEKLEPVFLDLHSATWVDREHYRILPDARRFENWEANYAGKIGLGAAMDYALEWGLEAIRDRVYGLADSLRTQLRRIPGVVVRDLGKKPCAIVTFSYDPNDANELKMGLRKQGFNISVTTADSTLLDMQKRGILEMMRASVHYYNTEEEIERFCGLLRNCRG